MSDISKSKKSDIPKTKKKFSTILYNLFFKRTSSYALALIFSSLWFERIFDHATEALFEHYNEGVSKKIFFKTFYTFFFIELI